MIGHRVHIEKQRRLDARPLDQIDRAIVVETVGLERAGPEVLHIEVVCDAGRGLKCARPQERAVERIEAEGFVAAARNARGSPR